MQRSGNSQGRGMLRLVILSIGGKGETPITLSDFLSSTSRGRARGKNTGNSTDPYYSPHQGDNSFNAPK